MSSWRTAEVLAAEDVLARSIADAEKSMRAAEKLRGGGREPSADDIRRIIAFARSPAASMALQALQRRIAGGHLSWRQVLGGEAGSDPGVRAALDADRENLAALCRGEAPAPPKPVRRRDDDEDNQIAITEDAW
ncbi:hypothetical protein [Umezawaea sp. Da 62-37]|uniref:hypothetical protein n=1 Tax=Umezawaea sp. Da 62-37 TaxID=3075927 RepID=UPI0028F70D88|nr:hypothetical protein [Umezawaea sp. Da 62-37]WNV91016.1 hypothetical protein RM788_22875 [Umezawaea sp. Da 62-37]